MCELLPCNRVVTHMPFENFPLHEAILANIREMGFTEPTQIQSQVMEIALQGKDLSGLSRTGTGKTAAFLIPTIQRLSQLPPDRLALCLAPTRELAQQIEQEAKRLSKDLGIGTISVVGGMSPDDQIKALRNGARIITGTPGRVIDLFKGHNLDLSRVDVLVFDEADRMFDMGFIDDMHFVLKKVNPQRQILLFSATMNFSVMNMIYEYGANPQEINVSRDQLTADKIQQLLFHVGDKEKAAALIAVCRKFAGEAGTIIVFVNYKERVPWVAALLSRNGFPAAGLSSLLRQEKRNKIIKGFKAGEFRALVATDVASRGLDIDDVSLVVNYHLPEEAATYVHRIGRTARAGKSGIAVAICSSEDAYNQIRVEEFLGSKIPVEWLQEEEMPKDIEIPGRVDEDEEDLDPNAVRAERPHRGNDRSPRNDRGPRRDGGRDRGPRNDRGPRGPRPERAARAPLSDQLTPAAPAGEHAIISDQVAPSDQPAAAAPHREPRHDRGPRSPRGDRGQDRHGRGRDRGGRGGRGRDRDFRDETPLPSAAEMPSPLTGNPIIYDMKTGKPKNRSESEFRSLVENHNERLQSAENKFSGKKKAGPAIMKKISSKVTALFGSRSNK